MSTSGPVPSRRAAAWARWASQAVRYSTRPSCSTCSGAVAARQDPVRSYPMPITLRRTGTHNTRTGTQNSRRTRAASPALVHASYASAHVTSAFVHVTSAFVHSVARRQAPRWARTAWAARRPLTRAPCCDGVSRWSPATNRPSPSATSRRSGLAAGRAGSARGTSAVCRWTHPSVGDPVDPGQLAADLRLGEPVGRPEKGRRHQRPPVAVGGVARRGLGQHHRVGQRAAGAVEVQGR